MEFYVAIKIMLYFLFLKWVSPAAQVDIWLSSCGFSLLSADLQVNNHKNVDLAGRDDAVPDMSLLGMLSQNVLD